MTGSPPTDLPDRLAALPAAGRVLDAVRRGGAEAYLVGGAVRDLWLGGAPRDLDLVVVGEPDELVAALGGVARRHDRFGTATVTHPDGTRYDLARARSETYPLPGALPIVAAAGIDVDLARRDFTVNALALGLGGSDSGQVIGALLAFRDLAARRLRVLHEASFIDDPTRLLRLARYAARLHFSIDPATAELARAAFAAGALSTVSGPRIVAELSLIAAEEDPPAAFAVLAALGVEDDLCLRDAAVARRALALLPAGGDRLALLLGLAGGPEASASPTAGVVAHLPPATRRVVRAVRGAGALAASLGAAASPGAVLELVEGTWPEAVAAAGALGDRRAYGHAGRWLARWRHLRLAIDGHDLLAAGVPAGPAIAAGLRAARRARVDGDGETREAQLAIAIAASGPPPQRG